MLKLHESPPLVLFYVWQIRPNVVKRLSVCKTSIGLTHVCLVLECVLTRRPIAVEMSRSLTSVQTVRRMTIFGTSKTKKPFPLDGIVFPVVIEMHLNIRCAYVNLVTTIALDAVVMGLFLVVGTILELIATVVHRRNSSKAIFECLIHFLMPLAVSNHFFFLCKIFPFAHGHRTVKMLTIVHIFTGRKATFKA